MDSSPSSNRKDGFPYGSPVTRPRVVHEVPEETKKGIAKLQACLTLPSSPPPHCQSLLSGESPRTPLIRTQQPPLTSTERSRLLRSNPKKAELEMAKDKLRQLAKKSKEGVLSNKDKQSVARYTAIVQYYKQNPIPRSNSWSTRPEKRALTEAMHEAKRQRKQANHTVVNTVEQGMKVEQQGWASAAGMGTQAAKSTTALSSVVGGIAKSAEAGHRSSMAGFSSNTQISTSAFTSLGKVSTMIESSLEKALISNADIAASSKEVVKATTQAQSQAVQAMVQTEGQHWKRVSGAPESVESNSVKSVQELDQVTVADSLESEDDDPSYCSDAETWKVVSLRALQCDDQMIRDKVPGMVHYLSFMRSQKAAAEGQSADLAKQVAFLKEKPTELLHDINILQEELALLTKDRDQCKEAFHQRYHALAMSKKTAEHWENVAVIEKTRADKADGRTEKSDTRLEKAEARAEKAEARAEKAEARAEKAEAELRRRGISFDG